MDEEPPNHDAQAAPGLTKTPRRGKLSPSEPAGGARIDALVRAVTREAPEGGRLVEVGYDRGAILLRALVARPDLRGLGIEIQAAAAASVVAVPGAVARRLALVTGDGFDRLMPEPGDVALLAGLGGRTIAEILTRHAATTRALTACVLCPSHLEADIRPALASIGWGPFDEALVYERRRYYEIITARPLSQCPVGQTDRDPVTAAWGPRLFERRDPLLRAFLLDARRRFSAAFGAGLRSYGLSGGKAALGAKLALLDRAVERASSAATHT